MDVENKLDEDFLFYLGFTNSYLRLMPDPEDVSRCKAWLHKLCAESYRNVEEKRNRNIYLSNLVLYMQEGKLCEPFLTSPAEVDISNAMEVFGHASSELREPEWLKELAEAEDEDDLLNPRDGRTYLATRTLPGGEGAFAYIAVTLAEEEPKWLGGGEGVFERQMEQKFTEYVPPMTEMERILLRRKDPVEREKVLTFYDAILQNINKEIDGEVTEQDNEVVNGLMPQLVNDLRNKGQYDALQLMDDKQRRTELLLMLHERVYSRRNKIAKREDVLDEIENQTLPPSFFDVSVQMQDKVELPAAMWEQVIRKAPNKRNMDRLLDHYPHGLIEKFLDLLSNEKQEIALRIQKRHENIVGQLRKELRRDGEKERLKCEEAERECQRILPVMEAVKAAYKKQIEAEQKATEKKKSQMSEQARLYEQMRSALYDTQRSVEEEAERGHFLKDQINSVNEQSELYQHVNDESVRSTEEANIALMRNIKRLRNAVKQYEARISQIQAMSSTSTKTVASEQFFIF